jgi:hypothetical protein
MKQYELTVKILVTVDDIDSEREYCEALFIAQQFAEMSMRYKSIGADKIIEIAAKECENV